MIAQAAHPLFFLALCLAGGLGAAARFALDGAITSALARRKSERAPKAVHAPKAEGSVQSAQRAPEADLASVRPRVMAQKPPDNAVTAPQPAAEPEGQIAQARPPPQAGGTVQPAQRTAEPEGPALPVGTVVVNLSGSFLLGVLVGFVAAGALPPAVQLIAGVGFLGGYTTFSTASFQTVQLLREGRIGASALIGLGQLLAGVALAAAGLALGLLW